ncbi:hypothetical protein FJZ40_02840 [Candidatus Shapirobacteria bacterium]|nr:hypothetical protein [Candidatus Shapirobacteria bacterium]
MIKVVKTFNKLVILRGVLFLLSLVIGVFVFAKQVSADMFIPSRCSAGEVSLGQREVDASKYSKIRLSQTGFGYCIDREEYCSKNKCGLEIKIGRINSLGFHGKAIVINLFINASVILLFCLLERIRLKTLIGIRSLIKILAITILGYFADFIAFDTTSTFVSLRCRMGGGLCGNVWYKSSLGEKIASPLFSAAFPITIFFVFVLVTIFFYKIYSNTVSIDKEKRVLYSVVFGIVSNPIWYLLYQVVIR